MIPLLAPPRSCSSLIAAMLGQHPELYATAELECFIGANLASCAAFSKRVPVVTLHGQVRSVAQLLVGDQREASLAVARHWLSQRGDWSGAQLVAWVEAAIAPRRLVEKSPIHVLRWDAMQRLSLVVTLEPLVHLVRHPVTAMRSLQAAYRRSSLSLSPTEALTTWVVGHSNILRWVAQRKGQPCLLLRCEDLLSNPEATLRRLCRHLDVEISAAAISAMLQPERSPYACIGPPSARTGNDPKWLNSPALRRRSQQSLAPVAQLWGVPELDPPLVMRVLQLAYQFGYS